MAHLEIGHRRHRQVAREGLPVCAGVVRQVDARLGAGVEQAAALRILAHDAHGLARPEAARDARPASPVIDGLERVGGVVAATIHPEGEVHGPRIMRRDGHRVREADAHLGRRHVGPARAAVARHLHEPIIGADVEHPGAVRRLGDAHDGAIDLATRALVGDRRAAEALRRLVVAGEIPGDRGEGAAAIVGAEQHVPAVIDDAGVVHRHDRGRRPVEAIACPVRRLGERELRPRHHAPREARLHVHLVEDADVAAAVHVPRVRSVDADVRALAARPRLPVALADGRAVAAAPDDHRRVVLLAAVQAVRVDVVHEHVVELRRGLVVLGAPAPPRIERYRHAAIVRVDQVAGIAGIDPELVIVAVRGGQLREPYTAIDRLHHRRVHHVHEVGVGRIGRDVHVVPRTALDQPVVAREPPALAGVVRPIEAALLRLHDRVDAVRVRRGHRDADLPHEGRQPLGQPGPRIAAVGRLPDAAARAAAAHLPGQPLVIPERGVEHARIRGIHREVVGAAGGVLPLEDLRPRPAPVGRAVDAALRRPAPAVALDRHVHQVRVRWMHPHLRDLPARLEAATRPRASGVGALVHPVAVRRTLPAYGVLARSDVHHVGVGLRDRDGADGAGAEEAVGDVLPRVPRVLRLPHPAAGVAGVVHEGLPVHARRRHGPPAAEGTDVAPLHRAEHGGVVRSRRPWLGDEECRTRGKRREREREQQRGGRAHRGSSGSRVG